MQSRPVGAERDLGVQINPATITETNVVKFFQIHVVGLDLFKSVTVAVTLYNEAGNTVGARSFTVQGDEYLAWNNDDQYLINLVAQKLGFTLA